MTTKRISRTSRRTRLLHTGIYLTTLALLLSGWWLLAEGEGRPSPLAVLAGVPDTRLHISLGWALAAALLLPLIIAWRGVARFARETFRLDRGDGRWWLGWPRAIVTGRFPHHEGRFDPGQRVANLMMIGGLVVLTVSGIGMSMLHGGPMFSLLHSIHRWSTFVVTPVIAGHVLVAIGILPGYQGVWRAMHLRGRVAVDTARRLWPAWTERRMEHTGEKSDSDHNTQELASSYR